jgi:hypothetical protein
MMLVTQFRETYCWKSLHHVGEKISGFQDNMSNKSAKDIKQEIVA